MSVKEQMEVLTMNTGKWARWAEVVVRELMGLQQDESLLVLTDTYVFGEPAMACLEAGLRITPRASLLLFETLTPGEQRDLSAHVREAMAASDAVISLCETRIMATPSCQEVLRRGNTRILATEPRGIEDFLWEGLLAVDRTDILARGQALGDVLRTGDRVVVTSAAGTKLQFRLGGRPVLVDDGTCREKGHIEFFPGVLVSVAPVEETIEGVLAVDGSVWPGGTPRSPIMVELQRGRIERVYGGPEAASWGGFLESLKDETVRHLCHFSIGVNPAARLRGNMLEDERFLGAVTCGFGNQDPKFGGKVGHGRFHLDVVLKSPTIEVEGKRVVHENQLHV